ncbi:hypothetical protein EVAR_2281_1 [Eumeta japonica]|uniref:Uncharacterized protein n=1 Tax=Eumeta variegata TaxID=151549 RepID=A0A4C1SIN1_EUMVA|nr:hypothetical protein EVAR_2281_1 [Eumeta japonica]
MKQQNNSATRPMRLERLDTWDEHQRKPVVPDEDGPSQTRALNRLSVQRRLYSFIRIKEVRFYVILTEEEGRSVETPLRCTDAAVTQDLRA